MLVSFFKVFYPVSSVGVQVEQLQLEINQANTFITKTFSE